MAHQQDTWRGDWMKNKTGGVKWKINRILADESQSPYRPQVRYKLLPQTGHKEQHHEPYLNAVGDLVIPFDCEPKYQWWVDGQSIRETKEEIRRNLVN